MTGVAVDGSYGPGRTDSGSNTIIPLITLPKINFSIFGNKIIEEKHAFLRNPASQDLLESKAWQQTTLQMLGINFILSLPPVDWKQPLLVWERLPERVGNQRKPESGSLNTWITISKVPTTHWMALGKKNSNNYSVQFLGAAQFIKCFNKQHRTWF